MCGTRGMLQTERQLFGVLMSSLKNVDEPINTVLEERVKHVNQYQELKVAIPPGGIEPVLVRVPAIADFYFVMESGHKKTEYYMSSVQRPLDDKGEFLSYPEDVNHTLKKQSARYLSWLKELGRDVYFTSKELNYDNKKITEKELAILNS